MSEEQDKTGRSGLRRRTVLAGAAVAAAGAGGIAFMRYRQATPTVAFPPTVYVPADNGYGKDPKFTNAKRTWPLTLDERVKATLVAAATIIAPGDGMLPSATALGIGDLIDEWVSAPYPLQVADRVVFDDFATGLDRLAAATTGRAYASSSKDVQTQVMERAALRAGNPLREGYVRFRRIVVGLVYTSPEGHHAIGYRGNEAMPDFPGPPRQLIDRFRAELAKLPPPQRDAGGALRTIGLPRG